MIVTYSFEEGLRHLDAGRLRENLFTSPEWFRVLRKTYRLPIFIKQVRREGRAGSALIYAVVKNFLEWKICVCSYCDYCDPPIDSAQDWEEILQDVRKEFPRYRIAIRNLRNSFVKEVSFLKELSRERFHDLDISMSLQDVWRRTHSSFRAAVRQAERKGVVVRPCRREELKNFYRLHLHVRKDKYKVFPQPFLFFKHIWDVFVEKDQGVLLGAFSPSGNLIGANMYLVSGATSFYKFNTSSQEALLYRPNNLLFWKGIEWAHQRGLSHLDLGSSGYNQKGLILFKNHTGAVMRDIVHWGYAPPDYRFSQKRILRAFTWLGTRSWMPDVGVEWGSRVLYPYLA